MKKGAAKSTGTDEHSMVARQMIAALEEAERKASKPQHAQELAASCFSKLQYDFPVVSAPEVSALADLLHQCLELKGGGGLGPLSRFLLTTKFVSNIVAGAKQAPHPTTAPPLSWSPQAQQLSAPGASAARAQHAMKGGVGASTAAAAAAAGGGAGKGPGSVTGQASLSENSATLQHLSPAVALQAAYQRLCSCVLLRYTAAALRLPEQDAWQLLAGYACPVQAQEDGVGDHEGGGAQSREDVSQGSVSAAHESEEAHEQASKSGDSQQQQQQQQQQQDGHAPHAHASPPADDGHDAMESDPDDFVFEPLEAPPPTHSANHHPPPHACPTNLATPSGTSPHTAFQNSSAASPHSAPELHTRVPHARERCWAELLSKLISLLCPDTLDALLPSEGSVGQAAAARTHAPTHPMHPKTPIHSGASKAEHEANRTQNSCDPSSGYIATSNGGWNDDWRPLHSLSSSSSKQDSQCRDTQSSHGQNTQTGASQVALSGATPSSSPDLGTPDLDLWQLSDTGSALMQLLRAIGVHERARDLQPLLQACVAVLGRRLAAHPEEMSKGLQELWGALGVSSVPSLPPVAKSQHASQKSTGQQAVLVPEASTALTLLVDLVNSHVGAEGRAAMWRQINLHTLPVLKRCLEDVAVSREVNPDTLDAVSLVSKVVLFFLENAPGGFNAAKALLSAGVVRAMAVVLPRFGTSPHAHELRLAVLLCAAASPEVRDWVAAVPGVPQTLSGPAFQLGGWAEAEGALWQLLQSNIAGHSNPSTQAHQQQGSLLLSLLDDGRCCHSLQQLQRVRAVLELLSRARHIAGRQPLWGTIEDSALRTTLGAIKSMLAPSSPAERAPTTKQAQSPAMNGSDGADGSLSLQGHGHPPAEVANDSGAGGVQPRGSFGFHGGNGGSVQGAEVVQLGGADDDREEKEEKADEGESEDESKDKARGLDAHALQARSMQRVGTACVMLLKGLVQEGRKMD